MPLSENPPAQSTRPVLTSRDIIIDDVAQVFASAPRHYHPHYSETSSSSEPVRSHTDPHRSPSYSPRRRPLSQRFHREIWSAINGRRLRMNRRSAKRSNFRRHTHGFGGNTITRRQRRNVSPPFISRYRKKDIQDYTGPSRSTTPPLSYHGHNGRSPHLPRGRSRSRRKRSPSPSPEPPRRVDKPHQQPILGKKPRSVSPRSHHAPDHLLDPYGSDNESNHTPPPSNASRDTSPVSETVDDADEHDVSPKPLSAKPPTRPLNQEGSPTTKPGRVEDNAVLDEANVGDGAPFLPESALKKSNEARESSDFASGILGRRTEGDAKTAHTGTSTRSSSAKQAGDLSFPFEKEHIFGSLSQDPVAARLATPEASDSETPFVNSELRAGVRTSESSSYSWNNSLSGGFNPFNVHCVPSESERRELFDVFDFETLHTLLHDLTEFIKTPSLVSDFVEIDGFAAIVYGTHISAQNYIVDNGKRVWHEDTTWLKVYYGRIRVRTTIPIGIGLVQDGRSPGHPNWQLLMAVVLNRMIVVSGGLLIRGQKGDSCLRGIIALQTIREMLHWRCIFRSIAHVVGEAKYWHKRYGTFTISEDEELCLNGNSVADIEYLDPTRWISERRISRGLVAWVNLKVDVIVNARDLLHNIELSDGAILTWCRTALQFGAGRDVQSAIAFVGVLRYMFVRKYLPAECAAATHLCANEFLDRANGVSELEGCLPELLGVSNTFRRGFDIDTGAITHASVKRKQQSDQPRKTLSRPKGPVSEPRRQGSRQGDKTLIMGGVSSRGLKEAEEGQVVLSAWTDRLDGTEWQVPRTVSQQIAFVKNRDKYRMSVRRGDVTCRRVGKFQWLRKHFDRMSGFQVMGFGISREGGQDPDEFASGGLAISNALGGEYGEEVCLHVLSWLHRGMIRLHSDCTAAAFVPKNSVANDGLTVNQHLSYEVCRRFVFARRDHELFWLPGEGLPCFRMKNCPNGIYRLQEQVELPEGVRLCRAEITKDFG